MYALILTETNVFDESNIEIVSDSFFRVHLGIVYEYQSTLIIVRSSSHTKYTYIGCARGSLGREVLARSFSHRLDPNRRLVPDVLHRD